jgi:hypothetical protein
VTRLILRSCLYKLIKGRWFLGSCGGHYEESGLLGSNVVSFGPEPDVSEENIVSIFRIEEQSKQELSLAVCFCRIDVWFTLLT